jgi:hypothetical protein
MRIAVITETYPPEVNGVALTVQNLVAGMAEDGHDICLVRPFQPGVSTLPPAKPIRELLVGGAALPKYPGLRFGFLRAGSSLTCSRLSGRMRVYVATEGPLGWSAVRARAPVSPSRFATGFHTRFDAYAGAYGLGPLTPLVRYWLRRLHNASGATVVPTPELREWLERHGFQRVRVVARGVDSQSVRSRAPAARKLRDRWGIPEGGLAVIYLGRIAAEKNLEARDRGFPARSVKQARRCVVCLGRHGTGRGASCARAPRLRLHRTAPRRGPRRAFRLRRSLPLPSLPETFGNVTLRPWRAECRRLPSTTVPARAYLRDRSTGRLVPLADPAAFRCGGGRVAKRYRPAPGQWGRGGSPCVEPSCGQNAWRAIRRRSSHGLTA